MLFTLILFITEEITGCTNETAKGANKAPRNPLSCCSISCFTVSVTLSEYHLNLLTILWF